MTLFCIEVGNYISLMGVGTIYLRNRNASPRNKDHGVTITLSSAPIIDVIFFQSSLNSRINEGLTVRQIPSFYT